MSVSPAIPAFIQTLLDHYDEGLAILHHKTRKVVAANDYLYLNLGISKKQSTARKSELTDIFHKSDLYINQTIWKTLEQDHKATLTTSLFPQDHSKHLEVEIQLEYYQENGSSDLVILKIKDISKLLRLEKTQRALVRISQSAGASENVQELLTAFHAIIREMMPADNFFIALYNTADDLIYFPYYVDEFDQPPAPQKPSRGLTEYILRNCEPLLVTPEVFDNLVDTGEVESVGAPSIDWIGVPLVVQQRAVGVMAVQSYTEGIRYTVDDLRFLTFVAPHVASAIQKKQSEVALRKQHDFIKSIFDSSPNAILVSDLAGTIVDCNQAELELMGFADKSEAIGRNVFEFIHQEEIPEAAEELSRILRTGKSSNSEYRVNTPHGRNLVLQMAASLIYDEDHKPAYIVGIFNDITQQKLSESALRVSEERYKLASEGVNDGIWDWDLFSNHIYYSPRWKNILGYEPEELKDDPDEWFYRIHPDDLPLVQSTLEAHLGGFKSHFETEHRLRHKDGSYRWVLARGIAIKNDHNKPARIAGSLTDVTQNKLNQNQLVHQALYDKLTDLPNRALFMERLSQAIKRTKRHDQDIFAILMLDLDRFKVINESLGHLAGDQMLVEVASRLAECLRGEDTVARLGGDEFAILVNSLREPYEVVQVINRVQKEITLPVRVENQQIFSTASIGVTLSSTGYERPEDMLRDADTALYQAKNQGGNSYAIFDKLMHQEALSLLHLESDLRQALDNNQFLLYYQPIFDTLTEKVVNAEALLRWAHPQHGMIFPNQFIPLAEETGLIVPIGEWVLRTACSELNKWHLMGYHHLKISVNFSARQFQQSDLSLMVKKALLQSGIDPGSLFIEITESRSFSQLEKFETMLWELKALGVEISIDDFGTGYSSLSTIQKLPMTNLKIGQSFIANLGERKENDLITLSIIEMAHRLGLTVIAEGVETQAQRDFLLKNECVVYQGFLFCNPIPIEQWERLLK